MGATRSPHILIIEDDPAVSSLLERVFCEQGYGVTAIANVGEPLREPESAFALVVTNSRVPYLSGEDLIQQIRERWPGVPVLHLDDLTRPLSRALPKGVPSIMKPFSIESLLSAVQHLTETDSEGRGLTG